LLEVILVSFDRDHKAQPDYAIGGAAGCVVASRLAQADPSLVVLLIESGPNNNIPNVKIPALYVSNLVPSSELFHWYQSQPEGNVGGRALVVPSGRILGGGSSVNVMIYSRAQRSDMNRWNTRGWTADELQPFMRKVSLPTFILCDYNDE
jgi:alcohol oxidase